MSMQSIIIKSLKEKSDERFGQFRIEEITSIQKITDDAYLNSPTWLGGDKEFVCLFIDLDNSSKLSFKKHPPTMAKIYDYFTQNIVDILSERGVNADYIDIKGDGAFGIYEGENAVFKAMCAAVTFKTFFDGYIRPKFQTSDSIINCKLAIDKDKILVRKLGKKGDKNNNEVWAGRVVNNASKLSSLSKEIYTLQNIGITNKEQSLLIISDKVYTELLKREKFTIFSCGHDTKGNVRPVGKLWKEMDCSNNENVYSNKVWYISSGWCKLCGDSYMSNILSNGNILKKIGLGLS